MLWGLLVLGWILGCPYLKLEVSTIFVNDEGFGFEVGGVGLLVCRDYDSGCKGSNGNSMMDDGFDEHKSREVRLLCSLELQEARS